MAKNETAPAAEVAEIPAQSVKTVDSAEPDLGWTVQHGSRPEAAADPAMATRVYGKDQLASVDGLKAQGIDPSTYLRYFNADEAAKAAAEQADKEVADAAAKAAAESAKAWDDEKAVKTV